MQTIVEIDRLVSISPLPHSVATDGQTAWIASRATRRIDVMDTKTWCKTGEIEPPGMPWGMNYGAGALVMTCGEGDDDNRRIRRYVPGSGFLKGTIDCPDDTGSHLALYGDRLLLAQWYNKVLLLLDDAGAVKRTYAVPHGVAGLAVIGEVAYALGTDDEDAGEYWITAVDLKSGACGDLSTVPFHARGLSWDGSRFWTNFREADRTVVFTLPT